MVKAQPARRPGTHGARVGRDRGCLHAREVARESFGVNHQKMREKDRLGMLHVSHAGHRHFQVGFGLSGEGADKSDKSAPNFCSSVDYKEAEIGGHEFVAAAAGVKFPAEWAEFFD